MNMLNSIFLKLGKKSGFFIFSFTLLTSGCGLQKSAQLMEDMYNLQKDQMLPAMKNSTDNMKKVGLNAENTHEDMQTMVPLMKSSLQQMKSMLETVKTTQGTIGETRSTLEGLQGNLGKLITVLDSLSGFTDKLANDKNAAKNFSKALASITSFVSNLDSQLQEGGDVKKIIDGAKTFVDKLNAEIGPKISEIFTMLSVTFGKDGTLTQAVLDLQDLNKEYQKQLAERDKDDIARDKKLEELNLATQYLLEQARKLAEASTSSSNQNSGSNNTATPDPIVVESKRFVQSQGFTGNTQDMFILKLKRFGDLKKIEDFETLYQRVENVSEPGTIKKDIFERTYSLIEKDYPTIMNISDPDLTEKVTPKKPEPFLPPVVPIQNSSELVTALKEADQSLIDWLEQLNLDNDLKYLDEAMVSHFIGSNSGMLDYVEKHQDANLKTIYLKATVNNYFATGDVGKILTNAEEYFCFTEEFSSNEDALFQKSPLCEQLPQGEKCGWKHFSKSEPFTSWGKITNTLKDNTVALITGLGKLDLNWVTSPLVQQKFRKLVESFSLASVDKDKLLLMKKIFLASIYQVYEQQEIRAKVVFSLLQDPTLIASESDPVMKEELLELLFSYYKSIGNAIEKAKDPVKVQEELKILVSSDKNVITLEQIVRSVKDTRSSTALMTQLEAEKLLLQEYKKLKQTILAKDENSLKEYLENFRSTLRPERIANILDCSSCL